MEFWRQCEVAWGSWLQANGWTILPICEAGPNTAGTAAPMVHLAGHGVVVAPDFLASKGGVSRYWEVKSRPRSETDPLSADHEHWIEYRSFRDYETLVQAMQIGLTLVVHERGSALAPSRWLRIDLAKIRECGRRGVQQNSLEGDVDAIFWPVSAMEVVPNGPEVVVAEVDVPVLTSESDKTPTPSVKFEPVEAALRSGGLDEQGGRVSDGLGEYSRGAAALDVMTRVLEKDRTAALDVLRRRLGIPALPRYSVLRVGDCMPSDVLGLLHYGIRVFLVTKRRPVEVDGELKAFEQCRLLEWATVPDLPTYRHWWMVDGRSCGHEPEWLGGILHAADQTGGLNLAQFKIVHAAADQDVMVIAGAGTGKTETMAERLVFLLATSNGVDQPASPAPSELTLDQVSLITFTREAAREMRSRLSRTIVLRQRMAKRCVLPTLAWLMQLGRAQISTIHTFAKVLLQRHGSVLGIGPEFAVSQSTMEFREKMLDELSRHLPRLFEADRDGAVPAVHMWREHVSTIWEALQNNGVPLLSLDDSHRTEAVEWGGLSVSGLAKDASDITRSTIEALRSSFADHCLREQMIPTGQLVPMSVAALQSGGSAHVDKIKYLFVDEFQDTDALQMELILELRSRLHARLFVVGDAKQGIYRFRGAEGDAFDVMQRRAVAKGLEPLQEMSLTRNFRTEGILLESLHQYFSAWGSKSLLNYKDGDKLRPDPGVSALGTPIQTIQLGNRAQYATKAAEIVEEWRRTYPSASIAVLCRRNKHALDVQKTIRERGGSCDLRVGGAFFTTPVVRELRVLMDAVLSPQEPAAILELLETRWAVGILGKTQSPSGADGGDVWGNALQPPRPWADRFATAAATGSFLRKDLEPIMKRMVWLRDMLRRQSALSLIVNCRSWFAPEACGLLQQDDESERRRYARGLDHLVTLMDETFGDGGVTFASLLEWLRLQIATNRSEDEPADPEIGAGSTTALTVHKAKGLEFDAVLIPNTWTPFGPPPSVRTHVTVLSERNSESRRVLWRWWPNGQEGNELSNSGADDNEWWTLDADETAREEARLLYVGMTRARKELSIVRLRYQAGHDSWGWLLREGEQNG